MNVDYSRVFGKPISDEFNTILNLLFYYYVERQCGSYLKTTAGDVPIIGGVPRFATSDDYASSFSFQWDIFSKTQLDSAQNTNLTQKDLVAKTQINPANFRGKLVLDIGVGIGRHAEYFAEAGAFVIGIDLSNSVEQAHVNLVRYPNAAVIQADLFNLPFLPASFDLVYSIGVLHHTPSWRDALRVISQFPRHAEGLLSVWIYGMGFARRDEWIKFTSQLDKNFFFNLCTLLAHSHRAVSNSDELHSLISTARRHLPFSVHHTSFERSLLALFDGYSPEFHAVATSEEVAGTMTGLGYVANAGPVDASCIGRRLPASAAL
jgi:SAM-dependent methyltransferase